VSSPAAISLTLDVKARQGSFTLDVSWAGECRLLGLFGPSGSGKTTLIEIVAGLRPASRAVVQLGDRVLIDSRRGVAVRVRDRAIGYVPQDAALFPHLNVRANITYGAGRGPAAADLASILGMLEIESLLDRPIAGLSGGERQRVALARALMSSPTLLLLDEPLSAVEVPLRRRILESLGGWVTDRAIPAIHVSHDIADLTIAVDRVLVLREGRLVADTEPQGIVQN
jgi:molybdate transport system ATP-binding protein